MKRIKILALSAMLFGSVAAVANTSTFAPTYGFNQNTQQWEPIAPRYRCDADQTKNCTAESLNPTTGQPTGVVKGIYTVLP